MSEKPTTKANEERSSDQELEQRLEDFTRRGLIRVGWVTPIVLSAALPAHAQPSHDDHDDVHDDHEDHEDHDDHDDTPHADHDDTPHDDHDDVHDDHDDTPHDDHDDTPHDDHDDHDDVTCSGSGGYTCAGIPFFASAVMTSWESQCSGSTEWTECCDRGEALTAIFEEPCEADLTLRHEDPSQRTLTVKIDYFTFSAVGCTNSSSFAEFTLPYDTEVTLGGSVQGDSPECTGFRIVEVKDQATGAELCKPDPCPEGDLGIYVVLEANGDGCPDT